MYRSFFKLREDPFDNCPDPRFFYNSPEHEEALASLQHVVTHRKGAILLTGAPGVGKTLVARLAFRCLGPDVRVAWLRNPQLSAKELLVEVCRGLHLEADGKASQVDLMSLLERHLISRFSNDTVVCIVIDEVQDFSCEAVRLLKTLNNLEVDDAKLVQLILLGHPSGISQTVAGLCNDFRERLYRILELPPLDLHQTDAYIAQRLTLAGNDGEVSFTAEAVARIHEVSGGIPRAINKIAEFALLTAFARSAHLVGADIVDHAIQENQLDAAKLMEPPANAGPQSNIGPEPATRPAAESGGAALTGEVKHMHRIARGLRARRQDLQDAVTLADATLEHLQDANANSHQNLTRLENTLEHTRLMTEAARTAETDLRSERDRTESQLRDRADAVAAQVDDLIGKLDAHLADFDRLQERARRAVADARDQIALLEQASQHSAGLAANIEELHGRARGVGDLYRSLQARLDATQGRIDNATATATDQIARLNDYQTSLNDRLDQARSVIAALAKVSASELTMNELLQAAQGTQAGLQEANRMAQQTLRESEDHVGDLTEALDRSRQHLKDAELILASARDDRKAAENTQQNTRELLETLTEQKALLDESMARAEPSVSAVQQARLQLEDLLANSRVAVDELQRTRSESIKAAHDAAEQVHERLEKAGRQLTQTANATETSLAAYGAQVNQATEQKAAEAARILTARQKQVLQQIQNAATEVEARAAAARENIEDATASAQQRVSEAAQTLADRRMEALQHTQQAAAEAEDRAAATRENIARATASAEQQLHDAGQEAAEHLEARINAAGNKCRSVVSSSQATIAGATDRLAKIVNQAVQDATRQLTARQQELIDSANEATQAAEAALSLALKQCETAAAEAHARIATAREELTDAVAETQSKIERRVDQTSRQCNDLLAQAEQRLGALESANADAAQSADSMRRLIRQLDETQERGLIQHRDAQRAHAELFAQTARAEDALGRLGEQLPHVEEAHKRTGELLLRVDHKVDELQQSLQQGDAFLGKAAQFLADFRSWKQELQRDRTQAAKVLRRARKHIASVLEAEARARGTIHIADEKTAKFDATLLRADKLLCETANELNRMSEAHEKTEQLLDRGMRQLSEHQVKADAIVTALEEKRLAAGNALDKLGQSTRAALQINKIQGRTRDDLRRETKRITSRAYAEREAAQEALGKLQDATRQAVEAVAQPRAVLEEAMQRVPQLQKLCKTLHEIYFKLNTHVPEIVTPGDWEKMCDSAEGATRQLLIANTARIRQLVDVTRRLFEKTAERMAHLQSENERASTLCRMLPRRIEESANHLAEGKTEPKQCTRTGIPQALGIVRSARSRMPAQGASTVSRIETDLTELSHQEDSEKVAALARRVARLAEIVQSGSGLPKPSPRADRAEPAPACEAKVESAGTA
ncbi:MAG: AAA family ATPase [Phycisphaerales bacterium]|nr:MAG: AAA family ATPase [Phycisphaerales bacterium]